MQKAKELVEELLTVYASLPLKKKPQLEWHIDRSSSEKVHTTYAGGHLRLEADCERNLAFGLQQTITALKSGHLGEYLGLKKPRSPLRLVRLTGPVTDAHCRRLALMGYNALICDGECDFSSSYGLKQFAKGDADGIFWESSLPHDSSDLTLSELVIKEMKSVEEMAGKKEVIFYVPASNPRQAAQHALWLSDLCDEAGKRTTIAFSAVAGEPTEDHLPPHPFWKTLRKAPDISSTPLMPILNVGAVKQGECLWPALSFDLLENFLPRLERHRFAGAICLTPSVPEGKGLLHLSLWVAAQALWHGFCPKLLAETWCLAHRPDLDFAAHAETLAKVKWVLKAVKGIEERESLIAELNHLELKFKGSAFSDYFTYFAIDMRNFLGANSAVQDSFFSKSQGGKSVILEKAQEGKTAEMKKIYQENY